LRLILLLAFLSFYRLAYADRDFSLHGNSNVTSTGDTGSFQLYWTTPGDDGNIGTASYYVIKYSLTPIADSNWDQAIIAPNPPIPLAAGNQQNFVVNGLYCGGYYYFGIKTYDDVGNVSPLSNITSGYASGIPAPTPISAQIDSLAGSAMLTARTVSSHYPIYYEFALDTVSTFTNPAIEVPFIVDTVASVTYGSLTSPAIYYWRCRAMASNHSDSSRWSDINAFNLANIDVIAPQVTITSPQAGDTLSNDSVVLSWFATDNGTITHFDVAYSTDAGSSWIPYADSVGGDSGYYVIPNPGLGSICGVRVACYDQAENRGADSVLFFLVSINDQPGSHPDEYSLLAAYPNPFNPSANIRYAIPVVSHVTIEVYDLLGHRIETLIDKDQQAGYFEVTWNADRYSSGTYFYKIQAGSFANTGKMMLIK
jgi:hypothetical protein